MLVCSGLNHAPNGWSLYVPAETVVTRFGQEGCTMAAIVSIPDDSLASVETILEKHRLRRDPHIAESAVTKLEKHEDSRKL